MSDFIGERKTIEQVEEGFEFAPKFDEHGLIPVVTTEYSSGLLLMQGYMNREALLESLRLGEAVYYSRSRKVLWHKGATSGLVQKIKEFYVDDDQDCVWLRVEVTGSGASCHVGYKSCFYRKLPFGDDLKHDANLTFNGLKLEYTEAEKTFDPKEVYGDAPNPTQL